jgi:GT2 family glycosyltransferase
MDKIYILILTWNSWQDTIECIESILKSDYKNFQIIIIDNDSKDNSIYFIEKYLNRELFPTVLHNNKLKDKILPIYEKKIPYVVSSEEDANKGGNFEIEATLKLPDKLKHPLIIIINNGNYGFAKGNNTALRFVLKRADFNYVWLLNNDTIIEKDTLSNLLNEAEKDRKIGFVGSIIRYYDNPNKIQTIGGGRFYPLLGIGKLYKKNAGISVLNSLPKEEIVKNLDYIMGASLLIKKEILEDVGVLDEDYFLYTEELDLITRAKKKGWKISVAKNSFVYHKESASTKERKWLYYYLINRSNMIYLKKHYNLFYNMASVPFIILNTLRSTRNLKNLKATVKGIWDGISYKDSRNTGQL